MPVETTIVLPQPSSTSAPAFTRIQDGAGSLLAAVLSGGADGMAQGLGSIAVSTYPYLFSGAASLNYRQRMASAVDVASQSGLGAALVAPPGMWSTVAAPEIVNSLASAVRAAGGAGIRHVVTRARGTMTSDGVGGAAASFFVVRDGASGVGSRFHEETVGMGAGANVEAPPADLGGFAFPGTAAAAATAEFGASQLHAFQSSTIMGYDAS